jgi:cytochrome P450
MVDSMNAEKNLSFIEYVKDEFLSEFNTFRTLRPYPPGMMNDAIHKGITRPLREYVNRGVPSVTDVLEARFTKPMSTEMTLCLADTWGGQEGWHDRPVLADVITWITRLSNLVFLDKSFARDTEWIEITAGFTTNLFRAIVATRQFHPLLRPIVDLVSPLNRRVRRDQAAVVARLAPIFVQRRAEIQAARAEGRAPAVPDDSIEWFRTASRGRDYPEVWIQLGLIQVAIQTTSDLMCQSVLNLCAHPEYVQPLREEAAAVLGKHGLFKESLSELRLLDSFIKETQRLKPVSMASMHRRAMSDVELLGGVKIKRGEHVAISSHLMWDDTHYEDPERFDGYRFLKRRMIPGSEAKSLLVATSPDHLGFAHGKLACPGRFLAANMLKVAMLHLILKYDMRIEDASHAQWWNFGENMLPNPHAKVSVRLRKPEVSLEDLASSL